MELSLSRETKLVIGQRMYQSMSFLQMGAEELDECLSEMSMENPLLEPLPPKEGREGRAMRTTSGRAKKHNGEDLELPIPDRSRRSLRAALSEQLLTMHLSPGLEKALRFLIINLDNRGYLPGRLRESEAWRREPELFDRARTLLRTMEPAGVGAEDLGDCLCLQLERQGVSDPVTWAICRDYLEHLSRNHINHIARAMGVSESAVMAARKRIVSLNPLPSNGYDDGSSPMYVVPDVELRFEEGEPVLYSSESYMPRYEISPYYKRMAESGGLSEEERAYFKEKLEQAQWALNCVKRRRDTLLRCTEALVEEQMEFFLYGKGELHPCTMADLAYRLGVHPSTVSRAMKNKYLACQWGVFPMSSFFTTEVNGDSPDAVLKEIREIISRENAARPHSDSEISRRLSQRGYDVARRTVAKYRDRAGIPPATGRKKRAET